MSKRTGISVEALTEVDYVASQTGTTIESFEGGIKKMQKALEEAAGGSAEAREALAPPPAARARETQSWARNCHS